MADITVHDLNKYYGENHVLKGITFNVFEGEKVGLVGKNGAGKTTLFKVLSGAEDYDSGTVSLSNKDQVGILDQIPIYPEHYTVTDVLKTAFYKLFELEKKMKELESLMESNTDPVIVKQYGSVQMEFEAMGGYVMDSSVATVCNGLDIDSDMQRRPFALLSGGEKTRVNLGRIILQDTSIMLLDEPTNHLDINSVEWLEDYMEQYKGTVIAISHDRYFLDRIVDRIVEIEDGRAELYQGNYSSYAVEKEERYQQKLAQYEQEQKKIKQLEETARRMHDWAQRADNASMHRRAFSIEKRIQRIEKTDRPFRDKAMTAAFQESSSSGREVITLKGLSKSFGSTCIADEINIKVRKDEVVALIGDNGCGKSTLLKIITGEVKPDTGSVRIGTNVKPAFLHQIITFDNPDWTVLDTVRYELEISEEMARNRLAAFHFRGDDVFKYVSSLSGGEKSRLRLCILMYGDVNLLILDEPTNHLDISSREWIEDAVESFKGTVLFVSHDRYFINRFATSVWEMKDGGITVYKGTYDSYRKWKQRMQADAVREGKRDTEKRGSSKRKKRKKEDPDKRIKELEKKITEMEERVRDIEAEMEESGSDFEYVNSLYEDKNKLLEDIDLLYEEYEQYIE